MCSLPIVGARGAGNLELLEELMMALKVDLASARKEVELNNKENSSEAKSEAEMPAEMS
jgi:hypothetical protein